VRTQYGGANGGVEDGAISTELAESASGRQCGTDEDAQLRGHATLSLCPQGHQELWYSRRK
jgi:hypothetical protein